MKDLQKLQREVGRWSKEQFEDNVSKVTGYPTFSQNALTGLVEEVGELNHVTICYHQGRRGYDPNTHEGRVKYKADRDDAIADIMIFLLDYCERENTDLLTLVNQTWDKVVSKRTVQNWEEHSHDSHTAKMDRAANEVSQSLGATISERIMKEELDESTGKPEREGWKFGSPDVSGDIECMYITDVGTLGVMLWKGYMAGEEWGDNTWWRVKPTEIVPKTITVEDAREALLEQNGVGWAEPSLENVVRVAATQSYPTEKERGNSYTRDCSKCGMPVHDTNRTDPVVCSSCYKPLAEISYV